MEVNVGGVPQIVHLFLCALCHLPVKKNQQLHYFTSYYKKWLWYTVWAKYKHIINSSSNWHATFRLRICGTTGSWITCTCITYIQFEGLHDNLFMFWVWKYVYTKPLSPLYVNNIKFNIDPFHYLIASETPTSLQPHHPKFPKFFHLLGKFLCK